MVILLWGKYKYLRLPMRLCDSPDIFQEKMSELLAGMEFCSAYIDNLPIISRGNFDQHLEHLEHALSQLSEAVLRINVSKSLFCRSEHEYLRY